MYENMTIIHLFQSKYSLLCIALEFRLLYAYQKFVCPTQGPPICNWYNWNTGRTKWTKESNLQVVVIAYCNRRGRYDHLHACGIVILPQLERFWVPNNRTLDHWRCKLCKWTIVATWLLPPSQLPTLGNNQQMFFVVLDHIFALESPESNSAKLLVSTTHSIMMIQNKTPNSLPQSWDKNSLIESNLL